MLIHKDPVGELRIENGTISVYSYDGSEEEPCIYCKTPTKKRHLGIPECAECLQYEDCCKQCKFGVERGVWHTNGNDWEDYMSHYTACAKRNDMGELRPTPDFDHAYFSSWYVEPNQKKLCYEVKDGMKK